MRDLERNKQSIWYAIMQSETDVVDPDGNYTGEVTKNYATPVNVYISLYPYSGVIREQTFGIDASLDMIANSSIIDFDEETLIFLTEPTSDYDKTYDFKITQILKSLNNIIYGLNRRT